MALTIADNDEKFLYAHDLNEIINSVVSKGVISGLEVSANSPPSMSVVVSSGIYRYIYNIAKTSSTTLTIDAADSTYDRYDVIQANSSGTISVVKGTASSSPTVPDHDSDAIRLAIVYVPHGATTIQSSYITDARIFVENNTTYSQTDNSLIDANNEYKEITIPAGYMITKIEFDYHGSCYDSGTSRNGQSVIDLYLDGNFIASQGISFSTGSSYSSTTGYNDGVASFIPLRDDNKLSFAAARVYFTSGNMTNKSVVGNAHEVINNSSGTGWDKTTSHTVKIVCKRVNYGNEPWNRNLTVYYKKV